MMTPCTLSCKTDAIVGICGGICGGLFGASSVLPAFWFRLQVLDRHRQRALMQPYIMAMQCASLLLLLMHGVHSGINLEEAVWWLTAVLGGVAIGTLVFRRISCEIHSHAILFLTFASGLVLVVHR